MPAFPTSPTHRRLSSSLPQNLETLAVTFHTGRITTADLAPLEGMRRLRSVSLVASRQAEDTSGEYCFTAFPDSLLRLKGLTSLTVSSLGACGGGAAAQRLAPHWRFRAGSAAGAASCVV